MYPNPFSVFRDLFSRRRTPDYEKPFEAKYGKRTVGEQIAYEEHQRQFDAVMSGEPVRVKDAGEIRVLGGSTKPPRPGDSLPKAYINTTQATLVKTINTYENEINALDKDIGKLSEERRQAQIAVDGMRAALEHMSGAEDQYAVKVDQLNETALVEALETL